ncbi:MAG: peptidoglycan DD-metalloendopeptidase family protein [Proteobacteria bacterium]|nr:peptidoglycan DD-metalloendopeptidase family protein [Pseudomonadota bacterium]
MFDKFFTVILIPRRTSTVKKIRIPVFLFGLGVVVLIVFIMGWTFMIVDYFSLRTRLLDQEKVTEQFAQQEKWIEEFSRQFEVLQFHYDTLDAINQKLRSMASIRAKKKSRPGRESKLEQIDKLRRASEKGVLEVIASDSSEIDSDLKYEQELRFEKLIEFFKEETNSLSRIPNYLPVKGFIINEFGTSTDPFTGEITPQYGIDIATRSLNPIYAPADGIVRYTKKDDEYGNVLVVDHGNGFVTRYGHIARFEVDEGDIVRRGGVIAQAGNTGRATGPRLHYEVILNDIPQNPLHYINER